MKLLAAIALIALTIAGRAVAADVYRCTVDGKSSYSDRPCGAYAETLPTKADPNAPPRGTLIAKAKVIVGEATADACWEGFRRFARDPTTAKMLSYWGEVADDQFAYVYVNSVFTNRVGGPERRFVRCRLTDELAIDEAVLDATHSDFFRSQMEQ